MLARHRAMRSGGAPKYRESHDMVGHHVKRHSLPLRKRQQVDLGKLETLCKTMENLKSRVLQRRAWKSDIRGKRGNHCKTNGDYNSQVPLRGTCSKTGVHMVISCAKLACNV